MPKLDFPTGHRGGPSPPVIAEDLGALAQRLLHDPDLCARDRVASVLIAVFAQPVSRVARLTADDVAIDAENVAIRFGDTAISMPGPVAGDLRDLWPTSPMDPPPSFVTRRGCFLAVRRRARWASKPSAVA